LPRCLVLSGGFAVNDRRHRHLDQQARRLGFADLRACLHALLDNGWSVPQLATHLDATQPVIRRAITDHHIHQPHRRQRLARQRQHAPSSAPPPTRTFVERRARVLQLIRGGDRQPPHMQWSATMTATSRRRGVT
jgi:hypothetical protein